MATKITLTETMIANLESANSYHPADVEESLNDGDYGDLMDYSTADKVRDATLDEALESLAAGPEGAFAGADGTTYYVSF